VVAGDARNPRPSQGKRVNPSLASRLAANVRWVFTLLFGRNKAARAKRNSPPLHRAEPDDRDRANRLVAAG
jgi:hypothetical protein